MFGQLKNIQAIIFRLSILFYLLWLWWKQKRFKQKKEANDFI